MTMSYLVFTPQGTIGVSDDAAGDRRFEEIFKQYGDCKVEVRDHNEVFGHGLDYGTPMLKTTITKLFE